MIFAFNVDDVFTPSLLPIIRSIFQIPLLLVRNILELETNISCCYTVFNSSPYQLDWI